MQEFKLKSNYSPAGDQPQAIEELTAGVLSGEKHQTLLGVTGSGKTFTMSNVIQAVQKPTLVISPNKTLAAQLYAEFTNFFPENAVEYFISYYDYYQPEAYIPKSDTFIEKDFSINDEIDRLRLKATSALVDGRRDIIIVASVSCIYSIGRKQDFQAMLIPVKRGMQITRRDLLYKLTEIYYSRNDFEFQRGTFRVRGDVIDIIPAYEQNQALRIEMFGDEIDKLSIIDVTSGKLIEEIEEDTIHPAKLFVTTENQLARAMTDIRDELYIRLKELREQNKILEAQRLEQRTLFDLEMMKEVGYCSGIENYSMHLTGRQFGERPHCIFDFFPEDYLLLIDESHITIPQIRGMYNGDRARKTTLVEHGFRLPSALENRPMRFDEYETMVNQVVYISATPGQYEMEQTEGAFIEQVIRPTGLLDPEISVRPVKNQIDDLIDEIRIRAAKKHRVLVTTLTKRMAEDLTEYLNNLQMKVAYIHSGIDSLERVEIIRDLRLGEYDVLVGVNLLREGLDLPEVSLVAVLDADKEGFLRSERSLLQVAGRTARNVEGLVIFYADRITKSMKLVMDETNRRRLKQQEYNEEHNINPKTVYKTIEEIISSTSIADIMGVKMPKKYDMSSRVKEVAEPIVKYMNNDQKLEFLDEMFVEMKKAAKDLDFERAAELRDEIAKFKDEFNIEPEKK